MNRSMRWLCCLCLVLVAMGVTFSQGLVTTGTALSTNATWLQIHTIDDPRGMDARNTPERTVIFTTAQPTVRQLAANKWMITFTP